MKKSFFLLLILLLALALTVAPAYNPENSAKPIDLSAYEGADIGETTIGNIPEFTTVELYGEKIDQTLFSENELTMLNIWGTFCGPCIREMPDLGLMAAEMPEGTRLVGLVGDAYDDDYIDYATMLVEETAADFLHIVPDESLFDFLLDNIQYYPTTIFVDSEGVIVGEEVIGVHSNEEYTEELLARLAFVRSEG